MGEWNMKGQLVLLIAIIIFSTTACATKRYPIATPMSSAEASMMTCKDLQLELLRADQVEKKINETGEFDSKTVIGFLGDFGIGNGMAKSEARNALADRRRTIHEAQLSKGCVGQ
jgi:hypothetical protein